jgi:recombinational DNA repair protein RecT
MSKAEVYAHRNKYVKDWQKNKAWKDDEEGMAKKTVVARLCRQLPMSVEFRTAMAVDGSTPRELKPDLAGMIALERAAEEGIEDETSP